MGDEISNYLYKFECVKKYLFQYAPDIKINKMSDKQITQDEYHSIEYLDGKFQELIMVCYEKGEQTIKGGFIYSESLKKLQRLRDSAIENALDAIKKECKLSVQLNTPY